MDAVTPDLIPAVERIYRELTLPEVPQPFAPSLSPPSTGKLDRAAVRDIIQRKRIASSDELQSIITKAKEFGLTRSEKDQLSVDLTIQLAQARQLRGKRDDPNSRFIAQVLNLAETPFGLIDRSFAEALMRAGSQNIHRCRDHQPPRCSCWCEQRVRASQILSEQGERSPEGWAAMQVYALLEELEYSARSETR